MHSPGSWTLVAFSASEEKSTSTGEVSVESNEQQNDPSSDKKTDNEGQKTFFEGALAGASAGMAVDFILFPIDTIKTRLQARNVVGIFTGFAGMYKGLSSALLASAPSGALFFGTYDAVKHTLAPYVPPAFSPAVHFTSAALAAAAGCLVRTPSEVIKQGVQAHVYPSGRAAFKAIVASKGIPGLYTGYSSLLLREIPFDAMQLCMYEQLKLLHAKHFRPADRDTNNDLENGIIGALAGGFAAALTCPLDVIKTRLMTQKAGSALKYTGIAQAFGTIVKDEGMPALFKGMVPRVVMIGSGGAIFFGMYEFSKRLIHSKMAPKPAPSSTETE